MFRPVSNDTEEEVSPAGHDQYPRSLLTKERAKKGRRYFSFFSNFSDAEFMQ